MSGAITREAVHEMWCQLVEPAGWTVCASELREGLGVAGIVREGVGLVLVLQNSVLSVLDAATYPAGEPLLVTPVGVAHEWGSGGLYERLEIAASVARLARPDV
jgi:hypothetical protein